MSDSKRRRNTKQEDDAPLNPAHEARKQEAEAYQESKKEKEVTIVSEELVQVFDSRGKPKVQKHTTLSNGNVATSFVRPGRLEQPKKKKRRAIS